MALFPSPTLSWTFSALLPFDSTPRSPPLNRKGALVGQFGEFGTMVPLHWPAIRDGQSSPSVSCCFHSAHPSLCPGPVPSFFPSHCQKNIITAYCLCNSTFHLCYVRLRLGKIQLLSSFRTVSCLIFLLLQIFDTEPVRMYCLFFQFLCLSHFHSYHLLHCISFRKVKRKFKINIPSQLWDRLKLFCVFIKWDNWKH